MNISEIYRQHYPHIHEYDLARLIAMEAFLRRTAQFQQPLMLKGSLLTRQYFPDPTRRLPGDLDFVLLPAQASAQMAADFLSKWVQAVTTAESYDGITFAPFSKNCFWRDVDYAMNDDFPTINTDLTCHVDGEEIELSLDVSFNLNLTLNARPLSFHTPFDSFVLPYITPLQQQIAWKLHQMLVRPRFKDIYDLGFLAQAVQSPKKVRQTLAALAEECARDGIGRAEMLKIFAYDAAQIFIKPNMQKAWYEQKQYGLAAQCLDLPPSPEALFAWFAEHMRAAGFTHENIEQMLAEMR